MSIANDQAVIALRAIIARINGVFDAPELMAFGPLDVDSTVDIKRIAREGIGEISDPAVNFCASVSLAKFLDGLRETGTPLAGDNKQITYLIRDALEAVNPDAPVAIGDARRLALELEVIGESLTGEADYDLDEVA